MLVYIGTIVATTQAACHRTHQLIPTLARPLQRAGGRAQSSTCTRGRISTAAHVITAVARATRGRTIIIPHPCGACCQAPVNPRGLQRLQRDTARFPTIRQRATPLTHCPATSELCGTAPAMAYRRRAEKTPVGFTRPEQREQARQNAQPHPQSGNRQGKRTGNRRTCSHA